MIAYFKINHYYNEYPDALSFSKDRIPNSEILQFFFLLKQIKNEQDTL